MQKRGEILLKSSKGFTLIEIILCLALLGILFSLTLPKTSAFLWDWQLEVVAKEVAFQMRITQMLSMRENTTIKILCISTSEEQKMVRYLGLTPQKPYYLLPKGIRIINPSTLNITYYPKGTPSVGCTLRLENPLKHRIAIVLSPVTGRIVIRPD